MATLIYRLENPSTGDRELAATLLEAQALKDVGWEVRKTFRVWEAGLSWKQDAELMLFCRSCGHLHPGPVCPPRTPMRQTNIPTPSRPQRVQHVRDPEPPMPSPGLGAPGAPATRDPVWCGMEDVGQDARVLAQGRNEVDFLRDSGFALRRVFRSEADGREWVQGSDRRATTASRHIRYSSPSRFYDRIDFPREGGIC